LGFALSFLLISTAVSLIGKLLHRGFRLVALGWADHLLGAVFGAGAALMVVAFGVYVMKALLPADSKFVRGSALAPHAESVARAMLGLVPEGLQRRFDEKLREVRARRVSGALPAAAVPRPGVLVPPVVSTVVPAPRTPPRVAPAVARRSDLVDVRSVAKSIRVDLRYATVENFLKRRLYSTSRCLLAGPVAKRLARVQRRLARRALSLKLWDCYRPLSVQRELWAAAPNPAYVGDPNVGSNHNRGAAVDVTLVDRSGNELAMPTDFDEFSKRAHHDAQVPPGQARNRALLRKAMTREGFVPLATEWWHFDAPDALDFPILDAPFDAFR
jgi:D-alanyl-D-alanine dipeptidase